MTALSQIDPRVKLLLLVAISSAALFSKSLLMLTGIFALNLLILLIGGVSPRETLLKIKGALGLICMIFILQCVFTRSGDSAVSIAHFVLITKNGLYTGTMVGIRLLIIVLSAMLVLTGESRDYLLALTQCRVPYEIAFMVMVALRFIPMLRQEAIDVLCALQMRGTRIKGSSLRQKAAIYLRALLPIMAGAMNRVEQMSIAMEARAFRAHTKRTSMRKLCLGQRDFIFLGTYSALLILIIIFL